MTAQLVYLPFIQKTSRPEQPRVIPHDPANRDALEFWEACQSLREAQQMSDGQSYGYSCIAESKLSRLSKTTEVPSVRRRALQALADSDSVLAERRPGVTGPFGGSVA